MRPGTVGGQGSRAVPRMPAPAVAERRPSRTGGDSGTTIGRSRSALADDPSLLVA